MTREVISALCYGVFAIGGALAIWSLANDARRFLAHRRAIKRRLAEIRDKPPARVTWTRR